jgi:hypothetical protein
MDAGRQQLLPLVQGQPLPSVQSVQQKKWASLGSASEDRCGGTHPVVVYAAGLAPCEELSRGRTAWSSLTGRMAASTVADDFVRPSTTERARLPCVGDLLMAAAEFQDQTRPSRDCRTQRNGTHAPRRAYPKQAEVVDSD